MFIPCLRAAAWAAAVLPALALAAPLTLDQALDLAVQRSEAARSARAGALSASEAAAAAGQLSDPMLRAGIENMPISGSDRFSTTRDPMTMRRIGIGQEWVPSEKRAARQAVADAMVGREAVSVQAAAAEVRLQTALAYLDAYFVGEALKLTVQAEHHLHEELEAAKGRLASSTASSQEVLGLSSARGLAEDESAAERQQQGSAQVALERWVGAPAAELGAPPPAAPVSETGFVENHPAVLAAQRETVLARHDASASATNRKPNWSWELMYGQRNGYPDMVTFGVNIPLQIAPAQRQDRESASKLAMVEKAEANLVEATRAAAAEYRALANDAQRLAERVQRYQTAVVTPAQQRTAAALAGYRSNQVGLTTLFEVRHLELEAQRKWLTLRRDLAKVQAQLAFKPLAGGTP